MPKTSLLKSSLSWLKELALLVVGIFIALSLNNWNANRTLQNKLDTYYAGLAAELRPLMEGEPRFQKEMAVRSAKLKTMLHQEIAAIDAAQLWDALQYNGTYKRRLPVFDELLGAGHLADVDNKEIKQQLHSLFQMRRSFEQLDETYRNQYNEQVLPFVLRHKTERLAAHANSAPTRRAVHVIDSLHLHNLLHFQVENFEHYMKMSQACEVVAQMVENELH